MKARTQLGEFRRRRGLAAAELARLVGVSRQTIYAIEDGTYIPNTTIALKLARLLEVTVEDLFALEEADDPACTLNADLLTADGQDEHTDKTVRLIQVNGRMVAVQSSVMPAYLPPFDGVIEASSRNGSSVRPLGELPDMNRRLLLAGCDPALSFLTHLLTGPGFEIVTIPCSSSTALKWLKEGRIHVAGSHLLDQTTGEYNLPIVQRTFARGRAKLFTFALWQEGLVLQRGNPKSIRAIANLGDKGVSIVNREQGSGSRSLLDVGLKKAGMTPRDVTGYDTLTSGHLDAALAVASGRADCCIATRSAAGHFGLDFVPLSTERFDLCITKTGLELAPGKALLDALNGLALRRRLEAIGYDVAHTGQALL